MSTKTIRQKLMEYLSREFEHQEEIGSDMTVRSWPMQEGVLISGNDAKILVDIENQNKELIHALELMIDCFNKAKQSDHFVPAKVTELLTKIKQ